MFALSSLRWGAFRDVASNISKYAAFCTYIYAKMYFSLKNKSNFFSLLRYWYLGPLKTRAAHWFSTLKVSSALELKNSCITYNM